jgi:hypothetical protein
MQSEARPIASDRSGEDAVLDALPDNQQVHQVACQAITDTLAYLGYHLTDLETQLITQAVLARIDYTLWVRGLIWAHHTLAERVTLQRRFYERDLATESGEPLSDLERFRRHCRECRIDGMELALDHLTWKTRQYALPQLSGDTSTHPPIPTCGARIKHPTRPTTQPSSQSN